MPNNANTAWLTFDDIARDVMNELMLDQRHYIRILGFVKRAYSEIYSIALPAVKTVLLEFENPNMRIIDFPIDYVYYTKIGLINAYGATGTPVIMTLSRNDRLHQFTDEEIAELKQVHTEVKKYFWEKTYFSFCRETHGTITKSIKHYHMQFIGAELQGKYLRKMLQNQGFPIEQELDISKSDIIIHSHDKN